MKHNVNRRAAAVFLALVSTMLVCTSAWSTTAVLVADTYVSPSTPANNFGTTPTLNVGGGAKALIQFDLSALPPTITAGNVARATLRLWVNRIGVAGGIDLAVITSAWTETGVTFSTQPTVAAPFASNVPTSSAGHWVVVDVTSQVESWISSPATNFGVVVSPAIAQPATAIFLDSKEAVQTSHEPVLDIVLEGLPSYMVHNFVIVPHDGTIHLYDAVCNPGDYAVGGGVNTAVGNLNEVVLGNIPLHGAGHSINGTPDRWTVIVRNSGAVDDEVDVAVVCQSPV